MGPQLPQGYHEQQLEPGVRIVARSDVLPVIADAILAAGSLYEYARHHGPSQLEGGRGPVPLLDSGGDCWAVRHYWRGGAVARLLGDRHLRTGTPRPLAELQVQAALSARGVATPQVVAAVTYELGAWYRGDVATTYIPDAADLAALTLGEHRWSATEREQAWFATGTMLRVFFATGARHADLNLRNILVRREPVRAYLLDLDRCTVGKRANAGAERAMLERFHRSRRKLERLLVRQVSSSELAAFKRGRGL